MSTRRMASAAKAVVAQQTVFLDETNENAENAGASNSRRAPVAVGRSLELEGSAEVAMENIVEKLKLLNYEVEFCAKKRPHWPALTRTYFALPPSNQNEQFFLFHVAGELVAGSGGAKLPGAGAV
mmetsp:Transcript_20945/g.67768  ORF Transcript_20945/g.67768 Transcript_20945/m.67768 type:complete len:125 (+) Transcript_20945:43-417(+)